MVVSVNYLRLRSMRFAPAFLIASARCAWQAARSTGYRGGRLLAAPGGAYWTVTAWDGDAAVTRYRDTGGHAATVAMTSRWGAAAAVTRWEAPDGPLPGWAEASLRLAQGGVRYRGPAMGRDTPRVLPDLAGPWRGFLPLAVPRLRNRVARTQSPPGLPGR